MGVPLLLTWLRSNFGTCVTYVAPKHTAWGRQPPANTSEDPKPADLPPGAKPRANIPNARRSWALQSFDNVYVDLNSLLYQSVTIVVDRGIREAEAAGQRAAHIVTALSPSAVTASSAARPSTAASSVGYETETRILAHLIALLDELLMMTNPASLVYIAVDGVSPKGKMSQQRTRRANTVRRGFHSKIKSLLGWDSNAITSGTLFMQRVTDVLHYYAISRVERANAHGQAAGDAAAAAPLPPGMTAEDVRAINAAMEQADLAAAHRGRSASSVLPPGVAVVINDVRIAGEGEHKIIDAIRSFRSASGRFAMGPSADGAAVYGTLEYNPNTSHCIVSPDTDVVVCALALHEPRVWVYWYTAQDPEDSQMFSLLHFRGMLRDRLGFAHMDAANRDDFFEATLHDLIFVLLLFGNDFLPKASALTDIAEGQLDKLLEFLVTDFVARGRHIVDATTGAIDFSAARYVIDYAVSNSSTTDLVVNTLADTAPEHVLELRNGLRGSQHGAAAATAAPFDPFKSGNDVVPGSTAAVPSGGHGGGSSVSGGEAAIEAMCYEYWGGLQWAMLYCTGPCPSWSWQYRHTTVPSAHHLSRYCGIRDDLLASCFSAVKTDDDAAMDVVLQLVLLMPFGSRELLPVSILDAYAREIAPLITDREFECIDLKYIMAWCSRQRAKLAAADALRLSSFNTSRHPTCIRYLQPATALARRLREGGQDETDVAHDAAGSPTTPNAALPAGPLPAPLFGGPAKDVLLASTGPDDLFDDMFDNLEAAAAKPPTIVAAPLQTTPQRPPAVEEAPAQSWLRVGGRFDCAIDAAPNGRHALRVLVPFFFDFHEELNVPGLNAVSGIYRCGDAATEKLCAPMVTLQSDWSRRRPCIAVGECRECAPVGAVAGPVLLPGTVDPHSVLPNTHTDEPHRSASKRPRSPVPAAQKETPQAPDPSASSDPVALRRERLRRMLEEKKASSTQTS